jgi:hypothetical protein
MRGDDYQQEGIFSYISPEKRVPADHPLRPIRKMVDEILKEMSPQFAKLYSDVGRPSIAPERDFFNKLLGKRPRSYSSAEMPSRPRWIATAEPTTARHLRHALPFIPNLAQYESPHFFVRTCHAGSKILRESLIAKQAEL